MRRCWRGRCAEALLGLRSLDVFGDGKIVEGGDKISHMMTKLLVGALLAFELQGFRALCSATGASGAILGAALPTNGVFVLLDPLFTWFGDFVASTMHISSLCLFSPNSLSPPFFPLIPVAPPIRYQRPVGGAWRHGRLC